VGKFDTSTTFPETLPEPIRAFEATKRATTLADVVRLIREHRLARECVPTHWLREAEVWDALLDRM
jgi:60 kDa SS-A/Ro ribonucleoprotein